MSELLNEPAHATLWTDALDHRGFLAQPSIPDNGHLYEGMRRVSSLVDTAKRIGSLIEPRFARVGDGGDLHFDFPDLGVSAEHMLLSRPSVIESGLFVAAPARFEGVSTAVRVYGGKSELDLYGRVPSHVAVVFQDGEHSKLAHSVMYLASHSSSTTRNKYPLLTNDVEKRMEVDRKSESSPAKSMASKVASIDAFDLVLQERVSTVEEGQRALRPSPPVRYLPHNAHALIQRIDPLLRVMVEASGIQRGLDAETRAAVQRASTIRWYQGFFNTHEWSNMLDLNKRWWNAQRVKLNESRNAAVEMYERYKGSIREDQRRSYDAIIYRQEPEDSQLTLEVAA